MPTINLVEADKILVTAWANKNKQNDNIGRSIENIINGSHVTYKYIMITALLAKATNQEIDALALQVKAPLLGSYDARSLCHKVIVPFERKYLSGALGNSNEPFLNKPARFEMLSIHNAVRKGSDSITLGSLISLLSDIKSSKDAQKYLASALSDISMRIKYMESLFSFEKQEQNDVTYIYNLICKLLEKSFLGETPVLVVASLEKILYKQQETIKVLPHKVNQSGSSSKEIGDIDIFIDANFSTAIEVKDKDFTQADVEHAIKKCLTNGSKKCMFLYGMNVAFDKKSVFETVSRYSDLGIMCTLTHILPYCQFMLYHINNIDRDIFLEELFSVAKEINCQQDIILWIKENL